MQRLLVIGVAIAMVTVFLPATSATHFSAGVETAVGNAPSEDPGNRSVEGDTIGNTSTPYGVGTNTTDCYDAETEVTADQVQQAATTDGFCGDLVYQEGTTLEQTSPPDQHFISDEIGTFDIQRSWRTFPGESTCLPMCNDGSAQNQTWNLVHTAGAEAGLTDGPQEAHEEENASDDGRENAYVVDANHVHPTGIVQRNLDVWEMNGWIIHPVAHGGGWIGFLEDTDGEPIDDERLAGIIGGLVQDGTVPSDAVVGVCGYTPDRNFQSTGEQGFCEVPMLWTDGEEGNTSFDGYTDECDSPTYVCGPTQGGHWQAEQVGLVGAYGSRYQGEHMRWHWMIAPHPAQCPGMEPGPDLLEDADGIPYLAHDLDVFTPPHRLNGAPYLLGTDNFYSIDDGQDGYATAFTRETPTVPLLPEDEIDEAVATFDDTAQPIRKGEILEPNHVLADTGDPITHAIDDNSRQEISEERSLTGGCSELGSTETEQTKDPWVNYVDAGVENRGLTIRDAPVEDNAPVTRGGAETESYGLYGTEDPSHDEENDPTPDVYATTGNVGIFTDKNDDGDYDVVVGPQTAASGFGMGVYDDARITDIGAYPMLWDMHVEIDDDGNAQIDETGGCQLIERPIAKTMKLAGYGPHTGLAQAIYLKEPTAFVDDAATDPQVATTPGGNNIYVVGNQAVNELWDGEVDDGPDDLDLSEDVDTLVEGLQDFAVNEQGADAAALDIVRPGQAFFDLDSDFESQCGEDTGGFTLDFSFVHNCEADCSGDTIATMYAFEAVRDTGHIGGEDVSFFTVDGAKHGFGAGGTWYDIDPFDGNADRNEERMVPPSTG